MREFISGIFSSALIAVTILKVEPGVNTPDRKRLRYIASYFPVVSLSISVGLLYGS